MTRYYLTGTEHPNNSFEAERKAKASGKFCIVRGKDIFYLTDKPVQPGQFHFGAIRSTDKIYGKLS